MGLIVVIQVNKENEMSVLIMLLVIVVTGVIGLLLGALLSYVSYVYFHPVRTESETLMVGDVSRTAVKSEGYNGKDFRKGWIKGWEAHRDLDEESRKKDLEEVKEERERTKRVCRNCEHLKFMYGSFKCGLTGAYVAVEGFSCDSFTPVPGGGENKEVADFLKM
jgi:hypothetical protein